MTVEDLEIGEIYEVVEEFPGGFSVSCHPELRDSLKNGNIVVGTLMKHVECIKNSVNIVYGFHFIIADKIITNDYAPNSDGVFWFSEWGLS